VIIIVTVRRWMSIGLLALAMALGGCGSDRKDPGEPDIPTEGLAVNSYLWRATLETLSFMPMVEANPRAGAVITDWYVNPDVPGERMKVSVFIMGTKLRADLLNVSVVRQERNESDVWVNQPVQASTQSKIEDAILAKARQLRIDSLDD